jgi:hypothetical protein
MKVIKTNPWRCIIQATVAMFFAYDTKTQLLPLQESMPSGLLGWPVNRAVFRHHHFSPSFMTTPGVEFIEPAENVPEDKERTSKKSSQNTKR